MNSKIVGTLPLLSFALLLSACNGVTFAGGSATNPSNGAVVNINSVPGPGDVQVAINQNRTIETLKTIQPTLAVRGMACLVCHADIRSNVVTDFGYGNPWFLGGDVEHDAASYYSNYVETWQTALNITGTVYVPDANVLPKYMKPLDNPNAPIMKLKDYMLTPYKQVANWDGAASNGKYMSMAEKVNPTGGAERVVAKSQIVIRAPSENEILALAPELAGVEAGFKVIGGSGTPAFVVMDNPGKGKYVMNNENTTLSCENTDVVIKGTLYLRRAQLSAAKGCRLYVSGSVFIEEAITFVAGEKPNLQITSARAISMGISAAKFEARMISDARGLKVAARDYTELSNLAVADAKRIPVLKDAVDDYSPRKSIDFSGILLNAPVIHSRYLGNVKGTVIAEAAIFAIGAFHFEFDPVFTEVSVLPKLKSEILVTK